MGDFRWLTVGPPGQDDVAIVLMAIPGPPMIDDEATDAQIRDLMAKGFAGTVFLTTDDCQASYEKLTRPWRRVHRDARGRARTASTPASATRPATASASPRSPKTSADRRGPPAGGGHGRLERSPADHQASVPSLQDGPGSATQSIRSIHCS